jgi:hypothetical protein
MLVDMINTIFFQFELQGLHKLALYVFTRPTMSTMRVQKFC